MYLAGRAKRAIELTRRIEYRGRTIVKLRRCQLTWMGMSGKRDEECESLSPADQVTLTHVPRSDTRVTLLNKRRPVRATRAPHQVAIAYTRTWLARQQETLCLLQYNTLRHQAALRRAMLTALDLQL